MKTYKELSKFTLNLQDELIKLNNEYIELLKRYNKQSEEYIKLLEEHSSLLSGIAVKKKSELCLN